MATQSVQGLFGGMGTPEEMQQAATEQKAMQFATMSPQQQLSYNIFKNTSNLGRGLAGAMGVDVQDPAIRRATMLRQMASQYDTNTPEGLKQYAQALQSVDPEAGMRAMQQAQLMEEQQAKTAFQKTQTERMAALAEQEKVQAARESKLASEFDKLPEDATEEDMNKVLRKYGDPKTVLQQIEKKAQAKYQADLAAETKREAIASKEREAQKDRELKSFLASIAAASKQAKADEVKPLSTGDIKMITDAKSRVTDYDYNINKIDSFLNQIDNGQLNFGMLNNIKETVLIGSGKAKEAAQNKVAFDQWAKNSVNTLLLKAKGTQTEGDAKRAAEQVLSALSRNDPEAVKTSLQGFKEILDSQKAADKENLDFIANERKRPEISSPSKKNMSPEDKQALEWANNNPKDPRAAQIKQRLGAK
jgi:hypothetical protein